MCKRPAGSWPGWRPHLDELGEDASTELPAPGRVVIRALSFTGRRATEAAEDDLAYNRLPLSPVFHLANGVITELRHIAQQRRG